MIKIELFGTDRPLVLESEQDAQKWLVREVEAWHALALDPEHPKVNKFFEEHRAFTDGLASAIEDSDGASDAVRLAFAPVMGGKVFTHDSWNFSFLKVLARTGPDAFALGYTACRSDYAAQWRRLGFPPQQLEWLRSLVLASISQFDPDVDQVARLSQDCDRLIREQRRSIEELQQVVAEQKDQLELFTQTFSTAEDQRKAQWDYFHQSIKDEWNERANKTTEEWGKLKKVYDTELGLRAPTIYWSDRARSQAWTASGYAGAFLLSMFVLAYLFVAEGLPYLSAVAKDSNLLLAVLPVLVPAFGAVWILRILGRLLSESLALMRDANERRTLVMTFLALMKDDETGKSVVKEEDRILILHALFRPSLPTTADDAPPVHWFDLLSSRLGSKK